MSKKPQLVIPNLNGILIDSDLVEHNEELDNYLASTTNIHVTQLDKFLSRPEFIAGERDDRTNIFIPGKARYYIPNEEINNFFILLEQVRRDGISLIFAEKQDEKSSGIMIDVDIYYKNTVTTSKLDDSVLFDIITVLMTSIEDIFDLTPLKQITDKIQIVISKRDRPVSKEHNGISVMSEGFHIIIPGIKINRSSKHYLINRIIKTGIIQKRLEELLKPFLIEENYNFIDDHSRFIPVFLIGCKRDPKKSPYELHNAYNYHFSTEYVSARVSENKELNDRNQACILVHELSVNYEVPNGIIKKKDILSNYKYANEIEAYRHNNRPQDIEE